MAQVSLPFSMQQQEESQWCWSAVSVSTDNFYSPPTAWTQCALVSDQLGQPSCCASSSSTVCDQPWYLNRALARVNHMGAVSVGQLPHSVLVHELQSGRPVGVRIQWNGSGNGHFVMITGVDDTNPATVTLEIDDPFYGHSVVNAALFPALYQTVGGSWSHTYQTI